MSKIIGIDLGTTNSCVAVMEGGVAKVIPAADTGRNVTPSVVEPVKNLVGDVAKRQIILNPKNTVYSIKRLMGRKVSDAEVKRTHEMVPYKIVSGKDGMACVEVAGKQYTPQEISAKVLQTMKAHAEAYLGTSVDSAVITVPAYFDDSQRKATQASGEIAGFKVRRILNEPTAAALAYGFNKKKNEQIVVYDFGGGTFDISVLEVGDDVNEVRSKPIPLKEAQLVGNPQRHCGRIHGSIGYMELLQRLSRDRNLACQCTLQGSVKEETGKKPSQARRPKAVGQPFQAHKRLLWRKKPLTVNVFHGV